jgi:hypothetical protein
MTKASSSKGYNHESAHENKTVKDHFKKIRNPDGTDKAECNHCGLTRAWNVTQFQTPHLAKCTKYQSWLRTQQFAQPSVKRFFKAQDMSIQEAFAQAVFTSTTNLSMFDTPEWHHLWQLLNFEPPNRKKLSTVLLDDLYNRCKTQVLDVARSTKTLQLVSDGSSTIFKERVENVSFMVNGFSFYWQSKPLGATTASADWTVDHILQAAEEITGGHIEWVTSFSSDTCNVQRSTWEKVSNHPQLKHVHCIACNSHSIQLVFGDLLWPKKDEDEFQIITEISIFFINGPNKIVAFFRGADKQLAMLRQCMKNIWGKIRALIATVPTRWGTQFDQIKSILDCQVPLQMYATLPDATNTLKGLLLDPIFWANLNGVYRLLEPLHTHQKMSESNHATLPKVFPTWMAINSHFQAMRQPGSGPFWQDIEAYCQRQGKGGWTHRMDKQLQPIHIAAYILTPVHAEAFETLYRPYQDALNTYIIDHIGDEGFQHFQDYLHKEGEFNPTRACWTRFTEKPKPFWQSIVCIQSLV